VDACDSVMDKMGYPRGLIRNTTQNALDGKPSRILRPRILVYGTLLLLLLVGFAVGIATRTPLLVDVIRDRNALYRVAADGSIENAYLLRIVNKEDQPHVFTVRIEGAPGILLVEAGATHAAAPEEVLTVPVTLRAPAGSVTGRADLRFVVDSDAEGVQAVEETRFFGPIP
jgi:polyferredoxin